MSIYRQGPAPQGTCPRCRETLERATSMSGVRVCTKCGGVFADNDTSRRLVRTLDRVLLEIGFAASLGKPRLKKDADRSIGCPECLVTMQKIRIESAACEIDACPIHGTWFDPGELEDVMRSYARSRKSGMLPPGGPPQTRQDAELLRQQADERLADARVHNRDLTEHALFRMLNEMLKPEP